MIKFVRRNVFVILLVLLIPAFYFGLTRTFYQQDEWHGLGDILAFGTKAIYLNNGPVAILLGKGRVLSNALVYLFIGKFPFNIVPLAVFAIFFHTVNSILVYQLALKFLRKPFLSFLGTIFFAFNGVSYSSVTWVASSMGTLPATTLILLSIFTFLNRKYLITFILIYLSLYFKEIGVHLFFFYPLIYFLSKRRLELMRFWYFIVFGLISIGVRVLEFKETPVSKDLFLTGSSRSFIATLITRLVSYPLNALSQIFVPHQYVFYLAKRITWNYYDFFPSNLYDLVAQSAVIDILSVIASMMLLFGLYLLFRKSEREIRNGIIFWIVFSLTSYLSYIIVGKTGSYLESRYYYLGAVSAGVLIGYLLLRFYHSNYKNLIIFITALLIAIHTGVVRKEVSTQMLLADERLAILNKISKTKNTLDPSKNVFYLTGDRNFYITEGNPIPMQQGMGYTLLVWYFAQGRAPRELRELVGDYYLWEMDGEGYREVNGIGYGYFWDKEELKKVVKKNNLKKENISAFYYDSQTKQTADISDELQI